MNKFHLPGFTLTELAVVLVIISLLIGTLVIPLSTQQDLRRTTDTQKILSDVRDALIGYAAANGRLPCPASSAGSSGAEAPLGGGSCTSQYGYVPGTTLGVGPVDSNGIVIDAWNNKVRYAVFQNSTGINSVTNVFTTSNGIKSATLTSLSTYTSSNPLLSVCTSASGITGAGTSSEACDSSHKLTDGAVAVIFSTGSNTATGGIGADEAANLDSYPAFVYHEPSPTTATNGEFDDIVIWLSPNILYNRMIAAGQLP